MIKKFTLLLFLLWMPLLQSNAFTPLPKNTIAFYLPQMINHKYVGFEFGFISQKKWEAINYPYNAFIKVFIIEESPTTNDLRAAGLGGKAGLLLPTQPWFPLYLEIAIGYAKTALHKSPWLGDRDDTVESKSLALFEGGVLIRVNKKFLFKITYQINNVDYFSQKMYFAAGVNF